MRKRDSGRKAEFTTTLECFDGSGWHYIAVSREIGERFPTDGRSRRVVCTLNGKETFQCALMPSGGEFFIMVNKRIRKALNIFPGNVVTVTLKRDTSKYGLPMPDEFEEVLRQDPDGNRLFHALTPGKQRSLIYAVSSGRDVDLRIGRALVIMQHLKENDGKINNEKLYHELRRPTF